MFLEADQSGRKKVNRQSSVFRAHNKWRTRTVCGKLSKDLRKALVGTDVSVLKCFSERILRRLQKFFLPKAARLQGVYTTVTAGVISEGDGA